MTSDAELLRRYAERDCQDAFAELVRKHLDLVYSTALRQTNGDAQLAQEVAQGVFADLARKAEALSRHPALAGWLYTSAYYGGCKAVRAESRRRMREQEAQTMHDLLQAGPPDNWENVRPVLDRAMHKLKEPERTAILLRYFENRPFSEIGQQLGLSEEAARKRVDRALDKLQSLLAKRGIATTATLAAALSAHAVQKAPAEVAAWLITASLAKPAAHAGSAALLLKLMTVSKFQTAALSVLILAGVLTPFVLQQRAEARAQQQTERLREQTNQLARLTTENKRLAGRMTRPASNIEASAELLKLRNEVGQLQRTVKEMNAALATGPLSPEDKLTLLQQRTATQVARLKQWLAEHPAELIPELQRFGDGSWIDAANSLEKDDDFARASSKLRFSAEVGVLNELKDAWQKYAANNADPVPAKLAQLKPYLDLPIDDAVLQRYAIVPGKNLASPLGDIGEWVITQAASVNAALDWRMGWSLNGINNILGEEVTNRWSLAH